MPTHNPSVFFSFFLSLSHKKQITFPSPIPITMSALERTGEPLCGQSADVMVLCTPLFCRNSNRRFYGFLEKKQKHQTSLVISPENRECNRQCVAVVFFFLVVDVSVFAQFLFHCPSHGVFVFFFLSFFFSLSFFFFSLSNEFKTNPCFCVESSHKYTQTRPECLLPSARSAARLPTLSSR